MISKKNIEKAVQSLSDGVVKTFEEMCFLEVIKVEQFENTINFNQIICIDVLEPMEAIIEIYYTHECKILMAENIYGKDMSQLKPNEIDDCQLEILNVIAGNFLLNFYGNEVKYKIDLPRILFDESELKVDNMQKYELYFNAENSEFKISLKIDTI